MLCDQGRGLLCHGVAVAQEPVSGADGHPQYLGVRPSALLQL